MNGGIEAFIMQTFSRHFWFDLQEYHPLCGDTSGDFLEIFHFIYVASRREAVQAGAPPGFAPTGAVLKGRNRQKFPILVLAPERAPALPGQRYFSQKGVRYGTLPAFPDCESLILRDHIPRVIQHNILIKSIRASLNTLF